VNVKAAQQAAATKNEEKNREMIMIKRFLAIAAGIALSTQLAWADPNVKGKLSIWLGYPETLEAFKMGQAEFKKKYPNVDIEILTFELREFEAKLAVSVPAGSGPDILALHDFIFPRYFEAGALDDVPADLAAVVNNASIIDTPFKNIVTREGKPWGVPWWSGRNGLFYNIDHLREAGLDGPPRTYDDVWKYAEKLTKKGPDGQLTRAGISLRLTGPSGGTQKFVYFYYQLAGEQMLEPGSKPGTVRVTIAKNIDAAARALVDHIDHLHGAKKSDDWALKHDAQGFASGAASMFMRESWVIPYVKKNGPDIKFGVVPVPRDKAWGAFNAVEVLSVSKDSKLKQAAWDFIRILQAQPILDNVLASSGWVPLRKDRDYSAILKDEPRFASMTTPPPGLTLYIEAPNTSYEEMTTRMGEIIQAAFRDASLVGNVDGAKKVMMRVHDTAVKILKDNGLYSE
jgi:multiple sugar transport system substrate-binding protein